MIDFREKPASPEDILHYGIKGMRWGVRKSRETTKDNSSLAPEEQKRVDRNRKIKTAAIGVGVLTAAVGATIVTRKLQADRAVKMKEIRHQAKIAAAKAKEAKDMAEWITQEPSRPVLGARGKHIGFRILDSGGVQEPIGLLSAMGLTSGPGVEGRTLNPGEMQKLAGKVAAYLPDPEGRRDAAGRPLSHTIVVPRGMADQIQSMDDVKTKVWPLLKPIYDQMYKESLTPQYND